MISKLLTQLKSNRSQLSFIIFFLKRHLKYFKEWIQLPNIYVSFCTEKKKSLPRVSWKTLRGLRKQLPGEIKKCHGMSELQRAFICHSTYALIHGRDWDCLQPWKKRIELWVNSDSFISFHFLFLYSLLWLFPNW